MRATLIKAILCENIGIFNWFIDNLGYGGLLKVEIGGCIKISDCLAPLRKYYKDLQMAPMLWANRRIRAQRASRAREA